MNTVAKVCLSGLVQLVALAVLLFGPAGDFGYWQAWVFLGVFAVSAWIPSIYLQATNPEALQRRMRGGPVAEGRTVQKVAMAGLYLSLASMCVIGALDHRFGWSSMPAALSVVGNLLVAIGLGLTVLVVIQNSYASTTVQVEAGQKVVSTGLYGVVRHPMYTANVIILVGLCLLYTSPSPRD